MNYIKTTALCILAAFCFTSCAAQKSDTAPVGTSAATQPQTAASTTKSAQKKIKMTVGAKEVLIGLYDTPTANALYDALPMDLSFSDFNGTEKIAYPPNELPTDGEPDGCDPDEGDLCLYAPWGNLCFFYKDFRYSDSLIKLGHIESGADAVAEMDNNTAVTLERID